VTGAGQGIGQAIALALAERGAQVIATDLAPPDETVNKIGPLGHAFQLDVTKEEDWRSISLKSQEVGDVDIVVNNAGYFPNRSIDELDLPTWRKTMATNLDAHFLSVKYFLPAMRKKKWGRFVGISSNMVGLAIPGMSHYITTKMGIIGFMRDLANKCGAARSHKYVGNGTSVGGVKARHLGTAGHQAARRTQGCHRSRSISDKRRCCIHHRGGDCRRRRSVSHRLGLLDQR
jgi:NAD(P)-dependent dehydrogenase (short-subunit alcohol dehydrogenase family)